jgi:hypothetical protein
MSNTPDSPAQTLDYRMDQGGNFWPLFTPGIWKGLHAVLQSGTLALSLGNAFNPFGRLWCRSRFYPTQLRFPQSGRVCCGLQFR